MGRDRAKEKIQAHRKAREERKEAKAELKSIEKKRETELQNLHQQSPQQLRKKGNKGNVNLNVGEKPGEGEKGLGARGKEDEADAAASGSGDRCDVDGGAYAESFSANISICGDGSNSVDATAGGGGYKDPAVVVSEGGTSSATPTCGVGASGLDRPFRPLRAHSKSLTLGNPNHRGVPKPIWKCAKDDAGKSGNTLSGGSHGIQQGKDGKTKKVLKKGHVVVLKLEDVFKADEIRELVEVLGSSVMDGVSVPVSTAAVALNRYDLVKRLVKEGQFDRSLVEGRRMTPFGCAIQMLNWEMIQFLVDKHSESVHFLDSFGNTPLIKAALDPSWSSDLMKDLWNILKHKSNTNVMTGNKAGVTIIHALAYRGWADLMDEILSFDPQIQGKESNRIVQKMVNAAMWNGFTPLMLAVDRGDVKMYKTLTVTYGANAFEEDKAGFTAVCRVFGYIYENRLAESIDDFDKLHPVLEIIDNILSAELVGELKKYINRRLQVIANPAWESSCFVELVYRLGRAIFVFILHTMIGGYELLLQSRIFGKLSAVGLKNLSNTDFIYCICGIFFEVLIYAQDTPLWKDYAESFLNEGAADLCLRIAQRPPSSLDESDEQINGLGDHSEQVSSSAMSVSEGSSRVQEIKESMESLAFIENLPPADKNISGAALMPFMQLIDSPVMDKWFSSHFETLSSSYHNSSENGCRMIFFNKVPQGHVERTNKKFILFRNLMSLDHWISPYDDSLWDTENKSFIFRNFPEKGNINVLSKRARKRRNKKKRPGISLWISGNDPPNLTPSEEVHPLQATEPRELQQTIFAEHGQLQLGPSKFEKFELLSSTEREEFQLLSSTDRIELQRLILAEFEELQLEPSEVEAFQLSNPTERIALQRLILTEKEELKRSKLTEELQPPQLSDLQEQSTVPLSESQEPPKVEATYSRKSVYNRARGRYKTPRAAPKGAEFNSLQRCTAQSVSSCKSSSQSVKKRKGINDENERVIEIDIESFLSSAARGELGLVLRGRESSISSRPEENDISIPVSGFIRDVFKVSSRDANVGSNTEDFSYTCYLNANANWETDTKDDNDNSGTGASDT